MTTTPARSKNATSITRRWTLDPARSTVEFEVRGFWGLTAVRGHFKRLHGAYLDGADNRSMELIIDAASLDTGNRRRDHHLRSPDFFDVEAHPQLRFTSSTVMETDDGTLRVSGEIHAAGKSLPLSFDATQREVDGELEVTARTTVDQRLLGMTWSPLGMIRPPATVRVKARLA
jgi:polyisoprenoid-binding protein YceI